MYTDAPVHQYTCPVYFFPFRHNTVTFPLIWWGMHTQIYLKIYLFIFMLLLCLTTKTYLSPQLLVYLPINVPVHDPACSFSYFYSIWLTTKIYPSKLLLYMSTDISVHQYTCSVSFFLFCITCTVTFPLICYGTYTKIYPEINLPIYLHISPLSNSKDLLVTTTTCAPAHRCTLSWP